MTFGFVSLCLLCFVRSVLFLVLFCLVWFLFHVDVWDVVCVGCVVSVGVCLICVVLLLLFYWLSIFYLCVNYAKRGEHAKE